MLLLFIFPVTPLCSSSVSSLVQSFILSPGIKFQKPGSLGTAATDGILPQLWFSLPVAPTMTKYQPAFSLVLLTDEPDKTLHFSLPFKKNGRNRPKLWQNDSWFEDYLTVIFCPQRRYLYSSRSNHNKFWWLAADIREMQTRKSCNFLRKVTICHWKSILKEVNWIPKNKIKIQ